MQPQLHLVGNAHIDPVWLWRWTEGYHEVRATFQSALDRLREDPDFIFTASSAAFYEWIENSAPAMFAEIRQRVAEGRWELAGGWWVEPDCNIPAGESFARHALLAQGYFREKFGRRARVGFAPDSFGHNASLPQLLRLSGLNYYVFMRPQPHEKTLPGRLFRWQSPDGSALPAYQIPYEYCTWGRELDHNLERVAAELVPPAAALMFFYGVGNHGGGPTRENLASLHRLQGRADLPRLMFSSPERFFDALDGADGASDELPVVQGELQHHARGCYAAHSGVKHWNRQAENLLLAAEKWAAWGQISAGQAFPAVELRRAWKALLFNQFHDILAGTSLEAAYADVRNALGEAMAVAQRAQNAAAQALAWQIDIPDLPGSQALVAFNPHAWAVRSGLELEVRGLNGDELLLDAHSREIPYQWVQPQASAGWCRRISFLADLPPLGYAVFRLVPRPVNTAGAALALRQASDTVLENEHLRLEIDPWSGAIAALLDRRSGLELFTGLAAYPLVIGDPSDTWSHGVDRFDALVGEFTAVSIRLVENGPVKATIRASSRYQASTLVQEFTLYRELAQIDVRVTVDWREQFKMLKLHFPLRLEDALATAEVAFGAQARPTTGEEEPCQAWVDVSGRAGPERQLYGLSLLNDAKYSYDVDGSAIHLTVLRSPVYANHLPLVPDPLGDYAFIDQGMQEFHYTLLPHPGSWQTAGTVRRAAELNQPAWLQAATVHPGPRLLSGSFMAVEPENVVVSAFKRAETRPGWVLRAYETAQRPAAATFHLPGLGRELAAAFGPAEIKTFFVPDDAALAVSEVNFLEEERETGA